MYRHRIPISSKVAPDSLRRVDAVSTRCLPNQGKYYISLALRHSSFSKMGQFPPLPFTSFHFISFHLTSFHHFLRAYFVALVSSSLVFFILFCRHLPRFKILQCWDVEYQRTISNAYIFFYVLATTIWSLIRLNGE